MYHACGRRRDTEDDHEAPASGPTVSISASLTGATSARGCRCRPGVPSAPGRCSSASCATTSGTHRSESTTVNPETTEAAERYSPPPRTPIGETASVVAMRGVVPPSRAAATLYASPSEEYREFAERMLRTNHACNGDEV